MLIEKKNTNVHQQNQTLIVLIVKTDLETEQQKINAIADDELYSHITLNRRCDKISLKIMSVLSSGL